MASASEIYRQKLRQKQQQEHQDKGKTGLGRKNVLDYSRAMKNVNHWAPKYSPESNAFDILPFVITQEWYRKLKMVSGRVTGLEAGDWDYKLQIPIHRNVGSNFDVYLCLREAFGGTCAICEEMFELYKAGEKDKAAGLRPGWRCFYNVYDYDDPEKGIQLWECSYYTFEATSKTDPQRANLIDAQMIGPDGITVFSDLQEGKTLVCKFKKKILGKAEFAEVTDISFESRESYDEDILRQVYPLDLMLYIPKPDEVKNAHFDLDKEATSSTEESAEKTEPVAGERSRSRSVDEHVKPVAPEKPAVVEQPAAQGGRTRGRGQEQLPLSAGPTCPAGKTFGRDCNTGVECAGESPNSCDELTFQKCLAVFDGLSKEKKEQAAPVQLPPVSVPPATTAVPTARTRRR